MNFDEWNWVSLTMNVMSKSSLGCSLNADVTCWTHDVRAILHLSRVFRDICSLFFFKTVLWLLLDNGKCGGGGGVAAGPFLHLRSMS